jgi:hypothetical protein
VQGLPQSHIIVKLFAGERGAARVPDVVITGGLCEKTTRRVIGSVLPSASTLLMETCSKGDGLPKRLFRVLVAGWIGTEDVPQVSGGSMCLRRRCFSGPVRLSLWTLCAEKHGLVGLEGVFESESSAAFEWWVSAMQSTTLCRRSL